MKNRISFCALFLSLCMGAPSLRAEAPPPFSAEAPEAGARDLLNAYLPLLASGEFEQAIRLNDLRGMRQYFLERRLKELKSTTPELTAADLNELSAQMQLNDLNPLRLKDILLSVLKDGDFEGMSWTLQGYAAAPEIIGGYVVRVDAQTAEGQNKSILLGIKKLGEQWIMAPDIIERMGEEKSAPPVAPRQNPPMEVKDLVDLFWSYWQSGNLNEAHALLSADYRQRLPLLPFLQQGQEVIGNIGIPASWSLVESRAIAPSVLALGVEVQGSKAAMQTLMIFKDTAEGWILEDTQFRAPPSERTPAPVQAPTQTPSHPPRFRQDLRPNLQPPAKLPVSKSDTSLFNPPRSE